jgi:hypothetical protein
MSRAKSTTFGKRAATAGHGPPAPQASSGPWLIWGLAGVAVCAVGGIALALLLPSSHLQAVTSPSSRIEAEPLSYDAPIAAAAASSDPQHNAVGDVGDLASSFSREFLELASERPDDVRRYIVSGIDECLPDSARTNWSGSEVKALAADIYLKTFSLVSRGVPESQRDKEFRDFVLSAAADLPGDQQDHFRGLMRNGLYEGTTMFCVASAVRGLLSQD